MDVGYRDRVLSRASEHGKMRSSTRQALTAGAESGGGGASPLDRSRLLFNDTHCLSLLQLLPNVI